MKIGEFVKTPMGTGQIVDISYTRDGEMLEYPLMRIFFGIEGWYASFYENMLKPAEKQSFWI